MSSNNKYPVFSFFDPVPSQLNKQSTAVESKPLGYREHKKQMQERHKKVIHDTKVWLGLIPATPAQHVKGKQGHRKKNAWGKKPWQQLKSWTKKKAPFKKKFDRFAKQKQWLKEWKGTTRFLASKYSDYVVNAGMKRKSSWVVSRAPVVRAQMPCLQVGKPFLPHLITNEQALSGLNEQFLIKAALNRYAAQQLARVAGLKKQPLTLYDKVFYYYTLQTPLTMYAHKAFILLEMQLNATLVRAKLVPYLFLVRDLCFYRLVQINAQVAKNHYQVVSLYDSVSIPVYLHNYMYYRQYRIQYYPQNIGSFFKQYWAHFTNYTNNKVWLLSNFITSDLTAEAILFDYPSIALYMGPFKRFTKLYYKNHPYAPTSDYRHLNHTHTVLKLKLFEYAAFYR